MSLHAGTPLQAAACLGRVLLGCWLLFQSGFVQADDKLQVQRLSTDIKVLASDLFEGRAPFKQIRSQHLDIGGEPLNLQLVISLDEA